MSEVRLSPEAEAELDGIWIRIARESGSVDVATRAVESIAERFWPRRWLATERRTEAACSWRISHLPSPQPSNRPGPASPRAFCENLTAILYHRPMRYSRETGPIDASSIASMTCLMIFGCLDDLRVQCRAAMERNYNPAATVLVNPMTPLGSQPCETRFTQQRLGLFGRQALQFRHELQRRW